MSLTDLFIAHYQERPYQVIFHHELGFLLDSRELEQMQRDVSLKVVARSASRTAVWEHIAKQADANSEQLRQELAKTQAALREVREVPAPPSERLGQPQGSKNENKREKPPQRYDQPQKVHINPPVKPPPDATCVDGAYYVPPAAPVPEPWDWRKATLGS